MNGFLRRGGYALILALCTALFVLMIALPEGSHLLTWMSTGLYFSVLGFLFCTIIFSLIGEILNGITSSYLDKVLLSISVFLIGALFGFWLNIIGGVIFGNLGPEKQQHAEVQAEEKAEPESEVFLKSLETELLQKVLTLEEKEEEYIGSLIDVIIIIEDIIEYEQIYGVNSRTLRDVLENSDNPVLRELILPENTFENMDV